ncbi:hypothetical protein [Candidatus Uabimicrobium sp. HlEnr_7]|uniref:hypothetical protein n=1 Tax=Candidatus Uabimicrobium helgolandensis TaxID=3095367 RepID=UPI0035575EDD
MKKFLAAFITCFLISNVLTIVWYTATADANSVPFKREQPDYLLLQLNHIVFAFILAYIYPIGYKGGSLLKEGFCFGVLMGILMFLPTGLVVRGIWEVPANLMFVFNTIFHALAGGVCGVGIAFTYGKKTE